MFGDKEGDRVIAVESATKDTVRSYGPGTYRGYQDDNAEGLPSPKIELDQGGVVWGYQCWWGEVERMTKMIGEREVIIVPPPGVESEADGE